MPESSRDDPASAMLNSKNATGTTAAGGEGSSTESAAENVTSASAPRAGGGLAAPDTVVGTAPAQSGGRNTAETNGSNKVGKGSAASGIAGQAKTAASSVAAAAGDEAQRVISEMSDEFEDLIEERKTEGAQQLHRLAEAIDRAGNELQEELPLVASYVKRGASKVDMFAETIRERDGRTLAAEAGDLIRRRPGMVAGLVGLVGFATVRLLTATPRPLGERSMRQDERDAGDGVGLASVRSPEADKGTASGDPDGVAPAAPGFGTASGTSGMTRSVP